MKSQVTERNKSIDIAKGIGILFVVLGHSWFAGNKEIATGVFSFHMPLFFFLSGLFFNVNDSFKEISLKKTNSLIKPYLTTLLIVGIVYVVVKNYLAFDYILDVLYASSGTIPWGPLWFLPHLFLVFLFSWTFNKYIQLNYMSKTKQIIILISLVTIGYLTSDLFWQTSIDIFGSKLVLEGLPFNADILFISTPYFLLGSLYRSQVVDLKINYIFALLSVLCFICLHYFYDYTIDMNNRRYDNLIVNTAEALLGIYIVLFVSSYLSAYKKFSKLFTYIGEGSLFIFIFHVSIQGKVFSSIIEWFPLYEYFAASIDFIMAVAIPLMILEIVKSNSLLSSLWLPIERKIKGN